MSGSGAASPDAQGAADQPPVAVPVPTGAAAAEAAPRTSHWRTDLIRISAVLGLLAALIAFGYFMQGPIKRMGPAERCWENREIDGKLYRFNPCTGQFRLLGDVIPGAAMPGSE